MTGDTLFAEFVTPGEKDRCRSSERAVTEYRATLEHPVPLPQAIPCRKMVFPDIGGDLTKA